MNNGNKKNHNAMVKKTIYISLPITGRKQETVRKHAERLRSMVESLGGSYVLPTEIPEIREAIGRGEDQEDPIAFYNFCMGHCVRSLLGCHEIMLGIGWRKSRGCRAEAALAVVYGLRIFEELPGEKFREIDIFDVVRTM